MSKKYSLKHLRGKSFDLKEQKFEINDKTYLVNDLVEASKDFEVFDLDINSMYFDYQAPCSNDLLDFAFHYIKVDEADLKYPIILHPTNVILDGRHRLIKALLRGDEKIKAVRFDFDNLPEPIEEDV